MFTVQIVTSNSEFSAVLSEWKEFLSHRAEKCSFWQDPCEIYSLVKAGGWDSMKVILLRLDGKIVCVAPCVIRRQSFNFQFGVLRIPGPNIRVLKILDSDLVYSKGVDKTACVKKVLAVLGENKTEFDVIYLENIVEFSSTWDIFDNNASIAGLRLRRINQELQVIRRQILAPSYDDWLLALKSKTRYNLKRGARRFFETYPEQVEFKRVSTVNDVKGFLDLLDELFPKTWQAQTFSARRRNIPEDVERLTHIAQKGWLRSYSFSINNEPVAFILGYQYSDIFEYAECGYDPKYSKLGVGTVLNYLMIKDLYEWGKPKILNFGYGENKYKRILGNEESNAYAAYLLFPSLWSFLINCQISLVIIGKKVKALSEKIGADQYLRKLLKRNMSL